MKPQELLWPPEQTWVWDLGLVPTAREAEHTHPGHFLAVFNSTFTCIIQKPSHFKAVVIVIFKTFGKKMSPIKSHH